MNIYFSTIARYAPSQQSGELVKLNWERKRVLARVPVVPSNPLPTNGQYMGYRGGGRGILLSRNEVYVASYHTIHVFDLALNPLRSFSNNLFAGIHQLCWEAGNIWAASTALQVAVKVDTEGGILETWWPADDPVLARRYRLPALEIDRAADHRLAHLDAGDHCPGNVHLNAVGMLDGRPLFLLNRHGCLVRLRPTEVLACGPGLRRCHNILTTSNRRILINDTLGHKVLVFDADGRFIRRLRLDRLLPVRKILYRWALRSFRLKLANKCPWPLLASYMIRRADSRPVYVRGLCETHRGTILVGISPAAILELDPYSGKLKDFYPFSRDINICIHGLECARTWWM
jgi:hypothetical protein